MTIFSHQEFDALLADTSKRIEGDIVWADDEDHSPCKEFRTEIQTTAGHPLFVNGSYNHEAQTLSFTIIHRAVGRIYALDIGKDHRNPDDQLLIGEKHKHTWTEKYRDKKAYTPKDIMGTVNDPVEVWKQFCKEASLVHDGSMPSPKPPKGLFDD